MTQIASMYGEAMYQLAKDQNSEESILKELEVLKGCFEESPDFLRLLGTPTLSKEQRIAILDESFKDKINTYLLNFLKILTEKGYISQFSGCYESYRNHFNRDMGILPVTAVTALALSQEQLSKLEAKLAKLTGKKVNLTNRVDPTCLGGVRLDYDGKQVNDTVAHRFDAIRDLLKDTVL